MSVLLITFGSFLLIVNLFMTFGGDSLLREIQLEMLKFQENKDEYMENENVKKLFIGLVVGFIFSLLYLGVYFIFIIAALTVDIYLIPTLIMIGYFIYTVFLKRFSKKYKSIKYQKEKLKNESLMKKTIINILYVTYITYILCLVVM